MFIQLELLSNTAMNHFDTQVCDTRLEVTVLRHDMNDASQQ